jgi:hypothetical protein
VRNKTIALAASCLPWVFFSGCGDDFAPYSQLDRLRVLAIQAEPATPLPGATALLSALTFAPGGAPIVYRWGWCPATAPAETSYTCPLDDATAAQVFAPYLDPARGWPTLGLGGAATASFTNPFSVAGLAAMCAAGVDSPLYAQSVDCEGGFPVTVVLDVSTDAATLRAGFVLRLPATTPPELNQNPSPAALTLAGQVLSEAPPTIRVAPEQIVALVADIPPAAAELRAIPSFEGDPGQRLERLTASWFADGGRIDTARTAFIDGETTLAETGQNRWTAPAAAEWPADGLVHFAVVLRDDRGGAGWLARRVLLEMGP